MKNVRHLALDLRNLGLTRLIIRISDGNGAKTGTRGRRGGVLGRARVSWRCSSGAAAIVGWEDGGVWGGRAGRTPGQRPPAEAAELPKGRAGTQMLFCFPFVKSKESHCLFQTSPFVFLPLG